MRRHVGVVFALSLAVGACNSSGGGATPTAQRSSSTSGGTTATDPCALLTQAEVSAVLGVPVGAGSSASDPHECTWLYPPGGVPTHQASIGIVSGNTLAGYCDVPSNSGLGLTVTQVSGVGESACLTEMSGLAAGTNLTFLRSGRVFVTSVALPGSDHAALLAADTKLALDALARL